VSHRIRDLVQRLALEQVEESFFVAIDSIEVRPMVEERLDDGGLGGFVTGSGVEAAVALGVRCVGVGAALQQQVDARHRREHADGIPTDTRGVPGTGEVQGGPSAPPHATHGHKLIDCQLHLENLVVFEMGDELGEETDEVEEDDDSSVEVGGVRRQTRWRRMTIVLLK